METARERSAPILLIGPGERLAVLRAHLGAVRDGEHAARVDVLGELEELFELARERCTLILDADGLAREDLGLVRRFLTRNPEVALVLTGAESDQHAARVLLRLSGARWMSWPPDLDDLAQLCGVPHEVRAHEARERVDVPDPAPALRSQPQAPRAHAPPSGRRSGAQQAQDEEFAEIEAILSNEPVHAWPPSSPSASAGMNASAGASSSTTSAVTPAGARAAPQPADAPHFREQVADLADIAQRIELSLLALRATVEERELESDAALPDEQPPLEPALDALAGDVARLSQFTRTLGFLVAPPAPGPQLFDVSELLELFVSSLVSQGPEAPRCLFRSSGKLPIRSDRQLLSLAFDAFFTLAQQGAGRGEIVRVQARTENEGELPLARISIEFPPGPFDGMAVEQILEPYGLRRIAPQMGANSLAAAISIIEGQGGHAQLARGARGRFEWTIELPRERVPLSESEPRAPDAPSEAPPRQRRSAARAEDPFA